MHKIKKRVDQRMKRDRRLQKRETKKIYYDTNRATKRGLGDNQDE